MMSVTILIIQINITAVIFFIIINKYCFLDVTKSGQRKAKKEFPVIAFQTWSEVHSG